VARTGLNRAEEHPVPAPKCPFQTPIIAEDFACRLAQAVTVRNTPQVHCQSETALALCQRLYEHLKTAGLAAFGMQDDLTSTPHNIYLKIQYGGLLGLQAKSGIVPAEENGIHDIRALVEAATRDGTQLERLPYAELVPFMQAQQTKRRRARRK